MLGNGRGGVGRWEQEEKNKETEVEGSEAVLTGGPRGLIR